MEMLVIILGPTDKSHMVAEQQDGGTNFLVAQKLKEAIARLTEEYSERTEDVFTPIQLCDRAQEVVNHVASRKKGFCHVYVGA